MALPTEGSHGPVVPKCADYVPYFPGQTYSRNGGNGRVDITDITSFYAPVRRLDTSPPHPNYHAAWDRKPGPGLYASWINIEDLIDAYLGRSVGGAGFACDGRVKYIHNMRSDFDYVNTDPNATALQATVNTHYSGGIVYPSASGGNSCCEKSWFRGRQYVYLIWERMEKLNTHTEHGGFQLTQAQHGLTNMNGVACKYGSTGDNIVDFGDVDFQAQIIRYYTNAFAQWTHYTGVYADDFNIGLKEMNCDGNNANSCSDPYTSLDCPKDPDNPTPTLMTLDQWTGRAAGLAEAVDAAFDRPFMVNTQPTGGFTMGGANHLRILDAVNYVEIEHGLNDTVASWNYVDLIHSRGAWAVWQGYIPGNVPLTQQNKMFALASYLMINNGSDFYMTFKDSFPDNWDSVYETDLGGPCGARFEESPGVWRRNCWNGYVTVNVSTGTGTIVAN